VNEPGGARAKKIVNNTTESSLTTTEYAGNYIYEDGNLQFFNSAEGYVENDGSGGFDYIYQYKDHLGNIRLSYSDNDGNGSIVQGEIREENNYYPFGLKHKGYNNVVSANSNSVASKYRYNGKEIQDELGLDWYDYGARNYQPDLGRWMNLDPLAIEFPKVSPYNYALNNPINFIDKDGEKANPVILEIIKNVLSGAAKAEANYLISLYRFEAYNKNPEAYPPSRKSIDKIPESFKREESLKAILGTNNISFGAQDLELNGVSFDAVADMDKKIVRV
jgi:RHS repeat-associated protein